MKPYYQAPDGVLYQGDVLTVLRDLEADSVQCCVTSPPYWGLRDYKTTPSVWGGIPACNHEWVEYIQPAADGTRTPEGNSALRAGHQGSTSATMKPQSSGFCTKTGCFGWRGNLGLEPTIDMFVEHMVEVFRDVRRVLRNDGTLWLNLGDSYNSLASNQNGTGLTTLEGGTGKIRAGNALMGRRFRPGAGRADGVVDERGQRNRNGVSCAELKPKDLCMVPARVALALQSDGWWLRAEVTWCKTSPMPESVTDRPTSATEKIFLFTKSSRYYYDAEAVKQSSVSDHPSGNGFKRDCRLSYDGRGQDEQWQPTPQRNLWNYWVLGPEPCKEAHFATFPSEIPRRAILAGTSERGCCPECGGPWVRVVEKSGGTIGKGSWCDHVDDLVTGARVQDSAGKGNLRYSDYKVQATGWQPTCTHDLPSVPCVVLDPFVGSGTSCAIARGLGRKWIGIDLSPAYLELARKRVEAVSLPMWVV
ncbi:MAG: site-specific DNA-methyltransferase [Dehalococcoidia bacterium]|nr:site-specific DNA-methyltransferase [Dehalococcoidia bacterium]